LDSSVQEYIKDDCSGSLQREKKTFSSIFKILSGRENEKETIPEISKFLPLKNFFIK